MKKFLSLSVAAVLALSMTACGSKAGDTQNADATEKSSSNATEKSSSNAKYTVGICQLVQHEALDAATKGFKDYLTEKLGDDVVFDEQNAQGDSATCATIVNSFVSKNEDLILANATAPLQSAAAATTDIPILGTSVTDYATALDISDWSGTTGRNISGTSDLAPLSEQAAMLNELFPDAKNVGLLYCSAEANSQYQIDVIKEELEKLNYTCTAYSFVDSNDIASVVQSAVMITMFFTFLPTTLQLPIQKLSITLQGKPVFQLLQVKPVSAKDVVLLPYPSATMTLDIRQVKWHTKS